MQKTFGPIVVQNSETNQYQAVCYYKSHYCAFAVGSTCTYNREQKERTIPLNNITPDWCTMKESALKDAKAEGEQK